MNVDSTLLRSSVVLCCLALILARSTGGQEGNEKGSPVNEFLVREELVKLNRLADPDYSVNSSEKRSELFKRVKRSPEKPGGQVALLFNERFRPRFDSSDKQDREIDRLQREGMREYSRLEEEFERASSDDARQEIAKEAFTLSIRCEGKMMEVLLVAQWRQVDAALYAELFSTIGYVKTLTNSPLAEQLDVSDEQRDRIIAKAKSIANEFQPRIKKAWADAYDDILSELTDQQTENLARLINGDFKTLGEPRLIGLHSDLKRTIEAYESEKTTGEIADRRRPSPQDRSELKKREREAFDQATDLYEAINISPQEPGDRIGTILSPGYVILVEISPEQQNEISSIKSAGMSEYDLLSVKFSDATSVKEKRKIAEEARELTERYREKLERVILPHQWERMDAITFASIFRSKGMFHTLIVGTISELHLEIYEDQRRRLIDKVKEVEKRIDSHILQLHREICDELSSVFEPQQQQRLSKLLDGKMSEQLKPQPDRVVGEFAQLSGSHGKNQGVEIPERASIRK